MKSWNKNLHKTYKSLIKSYQKLQFDIEDGLSTYDLQLLSKTSKCKNLKRIFKATEKEKPENIIRITADCPFLDPSVCEQVLFLHSQTNADYTSNTIPLTWPDGLDCEIFKFAALKKANLNAKLPSEREHVTKWIKANQNIFNIQSLICPFKNSYKYRWTIDYLEDFKMMKK